jgi:hypothetical protein
MHELLNIFACARPTAHLRVMETVDSYFEGTKPLFDEVSVGIVNPDRSVLTEKGQSDSQTDRREIPLRRDRVSYGVHAGTQPPDQCRGGRITGRRESTLYRGILHHEIKTTRR